MRRRRTKLAVSATLAMMVSVASGLNVTPAAAQEFYGHAAVNDDKEEQVSLTGSSRTFSLNTAGGSVYVPGFVPGLVYTLKAKGTFRWANGRGQEADAECMTDIAGDGLTGARWEPARWIGWLGTDHIDLKVYGQELTWVPESPYLNPAQGDPACSSTHTYTTTVVSTSDTMEFIVNDVRSYDNTGSLEITISRPAFATARSYQCPKWVEQPVVADPRSIAGEIEFANVMIDSRHDFGLPVPAYQEMDFSQDPSAPHYPHKWHPHQQTGHVGIYTCNYAMPDVRYKITVTGTYSQDEEITGRLGPQYAMADAECSTGVTEGDTGWERNRFDIFDPTFQNDIDSFDLTVGYDQVDWKPVVDVNSDGCADDEAHTYVIEWSPRWHGPIHFGIYDFAYDEGDNRGELCMDIEKLA